MDRAPDLYQCETCPICGTASWATSWEPQAVCMKCLDDGMHKELRVLPVYIPRAGELGERSKSLKPAK